MARPNSSSVFLSRNSVIRLPSLDKEGQPQPQAAAGWFEQSWKGQDNNGIAETCTTPAALRARSPPQPRRGVLDEATHAFMRFHCDM